MNKLCQDISLSLWTLGPLALGVLVACNQPVASEEASRKAATVAPTSAPAATAAPAGTARFGAPLSAAAAIPATDVLAAPARYDGKAVKISGQVGAVCQRKGCWMTLGSGEPGQPTVRVSFKDYGFFVSTDSLGKQAVAEGQFAVKTLSVAEVQHYADDAAAAGQKPPAVAQPQQTLVLVASGVEMR